MTLICRYSFNKLTNSRPTHLSQGCKFPLEKPKQTKPNPADDQEVLRKPSLRFLKARPRKGPAHLITDGQMNEYNLLEKRSLKGVLQRETPGPEPTESDPPQRFEGSGPGPETRPSLRTGRCALGRETRRGEGLGRPAHPPSQSGGGACRSPASTTLAPDLPRC